MSYSVIDFAGAAALIEILDSAVQHTETAHVTEAVKKGLCDLIREEAIDLPPEFRRTLPDCYARNLVYRSPGHGYEVIAMVWGPGQGTPLHDHAGIWCVDAVLSGSVSVTQFDVKEKTDSGYRFEAAKTIEAGIGDGGCLIPPFEYHTIRNPSQTATAITIHVYGGSMDHCTIFEPVEGGLHRPVSRKLIYN